MGDFSWHSSFLLGSELLTIGRQFDYCDPSMHFRSYIRSMIPHDAAILYAVLAISTKHRELMTGLKGIEDADEYERKCLEVLIPSLNDTDRALQDAALASALLLRLFEEMSGEWRSLLTMYN